MRNLYFLLFLAAFISLNSCDDGDIINFQLDFEDTFNACEGVDAIVFYKTKENPSESISVLIDNYNLSNVLQVGEDNTFNDTLTGTLHYRTYSDSSLPDYLFCNNIPPQLNITKNDSDAVTVYIKTILVKDDNDGVPASLELNEDTDKDDILNYIDPDDDGDNVLTKDENPDPNNDGDLSDAQDKDKDGTPDYLDDDDDGDGVKTRDEENDTQNNNPADDKTNNNIPDYLNDGVSSFVKATGYREHSISETYIVTLKIKDISLSLLSQDELDFGILEDIRLTTPKILPTKFVD